jgi:hypothetical protein
MKDTSVDKERESEQEAYIEKGTKIHTEREGEKDTHIK